MEAAATLPGRPMSAFSVPERNEVLHTRLLPPFPPGLAIAVFGMGHFWGAERRFWVLPGVWSTMVGYAGGDTPNPTFEEVCSGRTGHAAVVQVVFRPSDIDYAALLRVFWEGHDPTQGMRQGHDSGSQYRSLILCSGRRQRRVAARSRAAYQAALHRAGHGEITTDIAPLRVVYPAEGYHQQYLHKVPDGYAGLGGTGICVPDSPKPRGMAFRQEQGKPPAREGLDGHEAARSAR